MKRILRPSSTILLTLLLAHCALSAQQIGLIPASATVLLAAAYVGTAENSCEALKNLGSSTTERSSLRNGSNRGPSSCSSVCLRRRRVLM